MLKVVDLAKYNETLRSKNRGAIDLRRHYAMCMHMLVSRWAARITPHQFAILAFVLDRTVYHNKLSETVVFDQFLHGMSYSDRNEMVFCGLNISLPTLLKQLKELADDGYLNVFACTGPQGKGEIKPRLYAINCKKLFNLDIADEENPMILREPKAKRVSEQDENESESAPRAARNLLKTPKKVEKNPPKDTPKVFEGIYTDHRITKVIPVGAPTAAETSKKVEIKEVVARMQAEREAARQQRLANRPTKRASATKPGSMAAVQAQIDALVTEYHPSIPRVIVSAKAFGVFRKRLATAEVDTAAFLDWAIKFWHTTANAHAKAARKRIGETQVYKYDAMPMAPDFTTLSYRFPYFLACYRSFVHAAASGLATTREEQLERQVEKLQRTVQSVKDEARGAQERERNLRLRQRTVPKPTVTADTTVDDHTPARTPRIVRRAPPLPARRTDYDPLLDDDDVIPEWEEKQQPSYKRNRNA